MVPISIAGSVSVLTDIRYGKIRNRIMLLGFIWTLLLYGGFILYFLFFSPQIEIVNYIVSKMAPNGLIALGVGYFFWQSKLWAAGDAKLFALYAFLIPLRFYSTDYLDYFPSFMLLLNTFLIIIVFLLGEFLLFYCKKLVALLAAPQKIIAEFIKNIRVKQTVSNSAKRYLNYISLFLILGTIMQIPNHLLNQKLHLDYVLIFIIMIVFRSYFMKRLAKNKFAMLALPLLAGLYAIYLLLDNRADYLIDSVMRTFIFMVPIGIISNAFNIYIEKRGVTKIKINQLESHMIVAYSDVKEINKKISKNNPNNIFIDSSGSLTSEQVRFLKKFWAGNQEEEINVYKTLAFAPFMFLAFIITLFIKGSLISFILRLLN